MLALLRFRTYSKNIQLILLWNVTFCLGLGIHLVLYNLFLQEILHDEMVIGKILALNFLAQALIYIPAGFFSDRVGSKNGTILGVVLFIVALIGNLFGSNAVELSFWGFMIGLGHAASIVTFVPLLSEYSTSEEKNELFTLAFSTGTFFTFLGTLLSGVLSDLMKEAFGLSVAASFRITLSFTVVFLLLCLVPLFFVKKNDQHLKWEKNNPAFLSLLKNKPHSFLPILTFSISKALGGASLGIILPFMNLFLFHKFALSLSKISLFLAAGTLATVMFMSYNTRITQRFTEVKTVSLYHFASIPAAICLGISQNLWIAIIAFAVFRSAKFGLGPVESKLMMERVDPALRGLTNSFGFMVNSLIISMLGPVSMYIVNIKGNETGYLILFLLSSLFSLAAALYFFVVFGPIRSRLRLTTGSFRKAISGEIKQ